MSHALEDEYEALLQFLYIAPIGLLQARRDGEIVMVNPLCAQLLMPLSQDGDLSNLYTVLGGLAPDLRARVDGFQGPYGLVCEGWQLCVLADPPQRPKRSVLSLTVLKLDEQRVMAVLSDVTQSVERERELRHSRAWIHTIVNGLTDYALLTLDGQGRVRDWNASVERLTGHAEAASLGQPYQLFYPGETLDAVSAQQRLQEADSSGWSLEEGWRQRADGSRFWGSCLVAPLHLPDEVCPEDRAYSLVIRDVSERREAHEALRQAEACDRATGLGNRSALFEACELELQRWQRSARPLSLVLVGIDDFTRLQGEAGTGTADAVLRDLAAGLSATFRAQDVVTRLGSDTFAALLPGCDADAAAAVALRLCERVAAQGVKVDGTTVHYAVSVGVATMSAEVSGVDALVARAEHAMQGAKSPGHNGVRHWAPDAAEQAAVVQA